MSQSLNGVPLSDQDGPKLLDDIVAFIRDYIVIAESAADVLALYVLHEHSLAAFESTPYIIISSAEKQCGKTRLIDLLEKLFARPWKTVVVTPAQIIREIGENQSTLILDEADTTFCKERVRDPALATLRGAIDAGFTVDGKASVTEPTKKGWQVRRVGVFSCKVFAGIGQHIVPETVQDRGISIRMKRRAKEQKVRRLLRRDVNPRARQLRDRVANWAGLNIDVLRNMQPTVVEEFTDRQFDASEPLLAIADCVGGEWSCRAIKALKDLMLGEQAEDQSLGVALLMDIRRIRNEMGEDRIWSVDLVRRLCELEEPARDWSALLRGQPITANWLAMALRAYRDYGIRSLDVRTGDKVRKGYRFVDFDEACSVFCAAPPDENATAATSERPSDFEAKNEALQSELCSVFKRVLKAGEQTSVAAVALDPRGNGTAEQSFDVYSPTFVEEVLEWLDECSRKSIVQRELGLQGNGNSPDCLILEQA